MKFLIGFALLAVAFASPAVQPVELPEAPQPAIEDGVPEAIELQDAELPAMEFQAPSILPLFIPQEVSRLLNDLGEIREDVQVADIFDEAPVDALYAEEPSPVNFVDNAEEVQEMGPEEPSPLNFVDNAEAPEESPISPVLVVDGPLEGFENAEEVMAGPYEGSPLNFVDNAEAPEESPISPVLVVDGPLEGFENAEEVMAGPYEGSPLNFVDNAEVPAEKPYYTPVIVVDGPNMYFAEEDQASANNNMEAFLVHMTRIFDALKPDTFMDDQANNPANRFPDQPMLRTL